MKDKCIHKNIKYVTVTHYTIEKGYDWLMEQDDIDMQDYFVEVERDRIVCEDCAEVLDK